MRISTNSNETETKNKMQRNGRRDMPISTNSNETETKSSETETKSDEVEEKVTKRNKKQRNGCQDIQKVAKGK